MNKSKSRRRSFTSLWCWELWPKRDAWLLVPAILIASPAFAQETGGAEGVERGDVLEAVVVTAQRREENLQDVPISITTLSASALEAGGVSSVEDLSVAAPGLVMTRQLRGSTPFIRGVGTGSVAPGNESPVAQYVDGVYYMSPIGNIFSFNNVERIEVLKGPQGTLFGRNATGGLVNVITRDPSETPTLEASVGYGDYETYMGSVYASAGSERVAADLAVVYRDQNEGYGKNLTTGEEVNREDEIGVRSKVLWKPTDNDRLTFSADWSENKGDMGLTRSAYPGSLLVGSTPLRGSVYDTQGSFPTRVESFPTWGVSLKYQHSFDWGEFQSLTSHRDQSSLTLLDQDATPLPFVGVRMRESNVWQQQEFLLMGDVDRLNWTTGLFLFDSTSEYAPIQLASDVVPTLNSVTYPTQDTRSYAAFAQGTYAIRDTTSVTVGLRYTVDERDFAARQLAGPGHPAGQGALVATAFADKSFPKLTWRFAIDQKLGDDALIYASYNRGFKSGVYNTGSITSPVVDPETLDAIEVGLKSEWFDHRLRFNVAAFDYDYEDMQLQRVVTGTLVILNAAEGKMRGADIEAVLLPPMPVGELQLTLGASFLDTEYTSFPDGPQSIPNPTGGNRTIATDLSGNDMIRAPDWTTSLGVDYSMPVGASKLGIAASYYRNDGFFWEPDNRLRQDPYEVVNAQLSLAFGSEQQYRIRAFGKNLTDSRYGSYVSGGAVGDLVAPAPPRTYGVAFDIRY